ncbi:hypothetical protein [Estrella lausannensis]|uniref:Uncharacterized protein n=1 Tax=Estrella lausannensis TaxID=483423 RepID=A0A0H5DRX6_9BACT|nr:hypothetical protein [Estrella lausannensis]CRX39476.1 Conserved hypothetical protein [Estrella lausannensis]
MKSKNKEKIKALSLIEAVETLSNIADLKLDKEAAVTEKHALLFDDRKINYRTIHWLKDAGKSKTLKMIKEIFRVILSHLKDSWEAQFVLSTPTDKVESIKSIMILVGEAAKKLDRYTELFNQAQEKSVTELKEYVELKKFYRSKVAHVVDQGTLSKWLFGLTKGFIGKQEATKGKETSLSQHIFIDLEQIKKDTAYELLFVRKEDGSRFFNPRLIRNIKLVIDFGGTLQGVEEDRLSYMRDWMDKIAHGAARSILKSMGSRLDFFYKEAAKHRTKPLPGYVSSAIMALFLAASQNTLQSKIKVKTCLDYLIDFESYLHEAVTSIEYQKMAAYPPKSNQHLASVLFDTIHALIRAFFIHFDGFHELSPVINNLVAEGRLLSRHLHQERGGSLSKTLEIDHEYFRKLIRSGTHGPMIRNVEMLEDWESKFAPLLQRNWPGQLFSIYVKNKWVLCMKLPSPTSQDYINKAYVLEEFLAFLRASTKDSVPKQHLMFNLQDRTSWKEIARCKALEALPENEELKNHFGIVTLPFDTDFYHQLAPYDQDRQADLFKQHFVEQMQDENTGFLFLGKIKKVLTDRFAQDLLNAVHRVFFQSKPQLTRQERLDFIGITYLMLYFKSIELLEPDSISFTCKDSVDIGMSQTALMYAFMKLLKEPSLAEEEIAELHYILFAPALQVRERAMLQERFFRMVSTIKAIEEARNVYGLEGFKKSFHEVFGDLIDVSVVDGQIVFRHR